MAMPGTVYRLWHPETDKFVRYLGPVPSWSGKKAGIAFTDREEAFKAQEALLQRHGVYTKALKGQSSHATA